MAFDFPPPPAPPNVGQIITGPNGAMYVWNGDRWVVASGATLSGFLPITGGTMQGNINLFADGVAPMNPVTLRQLNSTDSALMQTLVNLIGAERLQQNTTFYVGGVGSQDRPDFGKTSAQAWQTLQYAANQVLGKYNFNGFRVVLQLADGSYGPLRISGGAAGNTGGADGLWIQGNLANPSAVVINAIGSNAMAAVDAGRFTVQGVTLAASGTGNQGGGLLTSAGGFIVFRNVNFATCEQAHIWCQSGGAVIAFGDYIVTAGTLGAHILCQGGHVTASQNLNVSLYNNPPFGNFIYCVHAGVVLLAGFAFYGAAGSGGKYYVGQNGIVNAPVLGAAGIPGPLPGGTDTGGLFLG